MPSHNHFTWTVNNIKEEILEIGRGKNIYHDGMINNGIVEELLDINVLIKKIFLYILLYEKIEV